MTSVGPGPARAAAPATPLTLSGMHHVAHVTWRPEQTVRFYRDVLGFPLVHTVAATGWLSADFPDFIHFFFDTGNGNHLAFFYYFGLPEESAPDHLMRTSRHLAFNVGTEDELLCWRERLRARGVQVTSALTHELVESVYFTDPNGLQLEIARPLRAFGGVDARDAALTLQALLDVVATQPTPLVQTMWRRKGELLREQLRKGQP